jgi:cobyrinic acid a,c-diamide synthase
VVALPRVVIAAPGSRAGKTTVATGLMAALRQRGLQVSPHKVGPDYIDPGYHGLAAGRPGRNLDPVMVGERLVAPLLLHGARGCDIAVIEGVMGLFDGRGSTEEGSTAHVAHLLEAPVILVVDASSQSTSVAALVHGFLSYDEDLDVAGVILNRVATDRHEAMLRDALAGLVPVVGVLRRDAQVETPSRHLGLVPVAERAPEAIAAVERLGRIVTAGVDLAKILEIASTATDLDASPWERRSRLPMPRPLRPSPRPEPRSSSSTRCVTLPSPTGPGPSCCPAASPRCTPSSWRPTRGSSPPFATTSMPVGRHMPSARGCCCSARPSTAPPWSGTSTRSRP